MMSSRESVIGGNPLKFRGDCLKFQNRLDCVMGKFLRRFIHMSRFFPTFHMVLCGGFFVCNLWYKFLR